jgi:hypothetical protein
MGESNGTEVWVNSMHGDAKAPVRSLAAKRACQYLVGKFFSNPTCWASGYMGRFKLAFREHYVPEGVLQMKLEEFIWLRQGGDTVMQYLNKFNHLSQYAIDQVDTDLKKKNCFMRGSMIGFSGKCNMLGPHLQ